MGILECRKVCIFKAITAETSQTERNGHPDPLGLQDLKQVKANRTTWGHITVKLSKVKDKEKF